MELKIWGFLGVPYFAYRGSSFLGSLLAFLMCPFLMASEHRLITNRTPLLALEPLVNALGVVLMRTIRQLLGLLASLKIIKAYRAGVLGGVAAPQPGLLLDTINLLLRQPLTHLTIPILQLHQLLIRHSVRIRMIRIIGLAATCLDGLLEQSLFFCFDAIGTGQTVHHGHHDHLFFAFNHLLLIHLPRHRQLLRNLLIRRSLPPLPRLVVPATIPRRLPSVPLRPTVMLALIFQFRDSGTEIIVFLAELGEVGALLLNLNILFFK